MGSSGEWFCPLAENLSAKKAEQQNTPRNIPIKKEKVVYSSRGSQACDPKQCFPLAYTRVPSPFPKVIISFFEQQNKTDFIPISFHCCNSIDCRGKSSIFWKAAFTKNPVRREVKNSFPKCSKRTEQKGRGAGWLFSPSPYANIMANKNLSLETRKVCCIFWTKNHS